ncbi:hypothetical protein F511_22120 [Dorcoceras hygrometricum]|uniref:Uncharacterized protein n=1 Tax=Dorcoceras hygrometricum TaxID=472368 RepID=A0A2Z7AC86_9LAMI|nr:hypothetical protein F511_22120 [Dorcoceras hygrometricum]
MQQTLDRFEELGQETCGTEVIHEEEKNEDSQLQLDDLVMASAQMEDSAHEIQDPVEEVNLGTKDKKASASAGISAAPSSAPVKSKKRKASSAPSHPVPSSRERKYSTRSSSRLVSNFSNTDDDPVDLVSSPLGLGDDEDSSGDEDAGNPQGSPTTEELIDDYSLEERNTGLAPESDPQCIPSDLSSRRARFQQLERSAINVDFGFSDAGASTSSQLIRCVPSVESLSFAKAAVRNFLELGLHQLGETQRLAMISAVSILRVAPEFSSDSSLLENVATIFSDSDAARSLSIGPRWLR